MIYTLGLSPHIVEDIFYTITTCLQKKEKHISEADKLKLKFILYIFIKALLEIPKNGRKYKLNLLNFPS